MQVIAVDPSKRQIDLSPRYVTPQEAAECANRFEKGRRVHNLMKHLAEQHHQSLLELYESFVYTLDDPWATFESIIRQPEETRYDFALSLFGEELRDSPLLPPLLAILAHQLVSKQVKIEGTINVTCYADNGVLAIREALKAGLNASQNEVYRFLCNLSSTRQSGFNWYLHPLFPSPA